LCGRRFNRAAPYGYVAICGTNEARPGFGFHEGRVCQQFAIQADARICPGTGGGAVQDMQLICVIDLRLWFFKGDGPA
jgi:S1-C subfamily serine protease